MAVNARISVRHRRNKLECLLQSDEPIGESAQEEVVALMESEAVNHCLRWQTAMAVLSFTLALLMFIAGVRQLLHPWDLRHHAFFNGSLSSTWVAVGEMLTGTSYMVTGCLFFRQLSLPHNGAVGFAGKDRRHHQKRFRKMPYVAVGYGLLTALMWACAISNALKVHYGPASSAWLYCWLPLGPPLYAVLAVSVAGMLRSTLDDVQALRGNMYGLKSV